MVLTDMVMPRMTGLEFLEQVKRTYPRIEVAVMTGHGSVETAVQAMKLGAYDYIAKPFSPLDELRLFLRRMADKVRLVEENLYLRERSETETSLHGIIGNSTGIQNVLRMISRLKDTRTPVLISGESEPARNWWPARCTSAEPWPAAPSSPSTADRSSPR